MKIRRFSAAVMLAAVMAVGMSVTPAYAGGNGNKKGGKAEEAICSYLLNIINYPYVSPIIRSYALGLYESYGCDPTLVN
jgi:hypothetical protein